MKYSVRQMQIITLVGRDDLSYDAVGETLGIHRSTIRAHVDRIIERSGERRSPREALVAIYWRDVAPEDNGIIGRLSGDGSEC